jgi:UPF0755 protein
MPETKNQPPETDVRNEIILEQQQMVKNFIRKAIIFLIALVIVSITVVWCVSYVNNNFIKPVDVNDATDYEVEIVSNSSLNSIAETLYEQGIIQNATAFKLFVDLSDNTSQLKAGKHVFKKSMSMQEVMNELLTGKAAIGEVTITIQEDWDILRLADYLVNDKGFDFTEEEFFKAATVENFTQYPFLLDISEERKNGDVGVSSLEGYLFPETYFVYENATPEEIIKRLLGQFEKEYNDLYSARAEELGMTTDQVITLASVIQKEARVESEFSKISAVFHNRLADHMALESCATVQYVLEDTESKWSLTSEEMATESPYNTYLYAGLPAGPICSPGTDAIKAALYPYEEYMGSPAYKYFVLMDPDKGTHSFNYSYDNHLRDKAKYEKLWKELE